jgi:hypothetical protein
MINISLFLFAIQFYLIKTDVYKFEIKNVLNNIKKSLSFIAGGASEENHRPAASHRQPLSHAVVSRTHPHDWVSNNVSH